MPALDHLTRDAYPKSNGYDAKWLVDLDMGPHPLWLLEDLAADLDLRPGMRVLDLGSGLGATSVFLAREYGVGVVAADLWVDPTEAAAVFRKEGVDDRVLAMRVDAHALPFGRGSFDAIVSIDAWEYFGTGDHYPPYLATFLKPGGQLGVATPALTTEVRELGEIPEHIDRVVGAESRRVAHRGLAAQPVGVQPGLRDRHRPQPAGRVRELAAVGTCRHGAQGTADAHRCRGCSRPTAAPSSRSPSSPGGSHEPRRHRPRAPAASRLARAPGPRARGRAVRLRPRLGRRGGALRGPQPRRRTRGHPAPRVRHRTLGRCPPDRRRSGRPPPSTPRASTAPCARPRTRGSASAGSRMP